MDAQVRFGEGQHRREARVFGKYVVHFAHAREAQARYQPGKKLLATSRIA